MDDEPGDGGRSASGEAGRDGFLQAGNVVAEGAVAQDVAALGQASPVEEHTVEVAERTHHRRNCSLMGRVRKSVYFHVGNGVLLATTPNIMDCRDNSHRCVRGQY